MPTFWPTAWPIAAVSPEIVSAIRDSVRRSIESSARRSPVLSPHRASALKPARKRTFPASISPIFLPIFMFDIEVICFLFSLPGYRRRIEMRSTNRSPDAFEQLTLVQLHLVLAHTYSQTAGHLFLGGKSGKRDDRQ